MNAFECQSYRFRFTALEPVRFPAGKAGNVVRGAFGLALRDSAPPDIYARIFEPKSAAGSAPSGFADLPRPFVFRLSPAASLDPGAHWALGLYLFGSSASLFPHFEAALRKMADDGLGPARGRLRLEPECDNAAFYIDLDEPHSAITSLELEFRTPTELKSGGETVGDPTFAALFPRVRDRIATLAAFYGPRSPRRRFPRIGRARRRHPDPAAGDSLAARHPNLQPHRPDASHRRLHRRSRIRGRAR